jgi:hypothetical protein
MVTEEADLNEILSRSKVAAKRHLTTSQTTYIEIELSFEAPIVELYRVHFDGKQEFQLQRKDLESISVKSEHPLLLDYSEETVDVHLDGQINDRDGFAIALHDVAESVFAGWRAYERYLNLPLDRFLEKPYGLLMTAPEAFVKRIVELGPKFGVNLFTRNERKAKGKFNVLILDDMYVIAKEFRAQCVRFASG